MTASCYKRGELIIMTNLIIMTRLIMRTSLIILDICALK